MRLSTLISKRLLVQVLVVGLFAVLALLQTSPASAASASKSCSVTTPNVYACTFTIIPGVAVGAGSWLVQTAGPGTFTSPSVVSSSSGCSSAAVTAGGTPINPPTSTAASDYNVTIGGTGCSPSAVVVVTETITVTSTGSVCQTVWITAAMPGITACATVQFAKSLTFTGGTIAPVGVSIVSFTGTTMQLDAAGAANVPKITSVSATAGGKLITYVIGAPAFVNVEFNAAFPMGLNATLVIVKTG